MVLAGLERGLTVSDIKAMQLGQLVDFIIEYNEREQRVRKAQEKKEKQGTRRKATPADIRGFFG